MKPSVAIVGAGIMGRILALLACKKYSVTLFDKSPLEATESCSFVAAGMLAPFCELETCGPQVYRWGKDSLTKWRAILNTLGLPVFFQHKGTLLVSHPADRAELPMMARRIKKKLAHFEPSMVESFEVRQEIHDLEPELGERFHQALYFPEEGQISTSQVMGALQTYLADKVHFVQKNIHSKEELKILKDCFEMVIDSRGLGSRSTHPQQLRGVRGELLHVHAPGVNLHRPIRFFHPRYPLYVLPRPEGKYILGASLIESEDTSSVSIKTTMELLSAAYCLHPGFAEARILEMKTHLRPALMDNEPSVVQEENLFFVNGLYRHGYLLAPSLGQLMMDKLDQHFYPQPLFQNHGESSTPQSLKVQHGS